jgi:hypothetical protein
MPIIWPLFRIRIVPEMNTVQATFVCRHRDDGKDEKREGQVTCRPLQLQRLSTEY